MSPSKVADTRVARAADNLQAIEPEVAEASRQLVEVERGHRSLITEIAELDAKISERSERIDALVRRLPPAEAAVHRQRAELATMRSRVEMLRNQLAEKRPAFQMFVDEKSREMVARSQEIKAPFEEYARGFLLETCSLVWSPQRARVGQTGDLIEFPAFELEMSGSDFPSPVRRGGPEQVSESQREFIDLAFRMSLMEVAGSSGVGSLVIDAPESSLDAVFVSRAASVLARYADPSRGNRLAVTSNLVEGRLIPMLLQLSSSPKDHHSRLVDLFKIAEPTAAVREHRREYEEILQTMLSELGTSSSAHGQVVKVPTKATKARLGSRPRKS